MSGRSARARRGKLVATRAPARSASDSHGGLGRDRSLERARAEAEAKQLDDVRAALLDDVEPGDAAIDDAVLHVLGHVVGAHEQRLHGRVAAGERERAVARRLRAEPRVVQELDRRLAQPALRRDRDPQAALAAPAPERERVAALAAAQPLRDPSHRRRRGVRPPRHLQVRQPLVQELRDLPAVRHRVQLRHRAEIPQESLHLVPRPEGGDRREELLVLRGRPMSWARCGRRLPSC